MQWTIIRTTMATPTILRLEHGLHMSDAQRVLLLREQVAELQRALREAREENALLTYERDELVSALKGWAAPDPDGMGDPFTSFELDELHGDPVHRMPLEQDPTRSTRKGENRMRA
jgi:hypothetical protein